MIAWLRSSSAEKAVGVLAERNLNMSQQGVLAAKKVNIILDCITSSIAMKLRQVTFSLYSAVARLHLKYCIQFGERLDKLVQVQQRATKLVRGQEHLSCEEKLLRWFLQPVEKRD